MEGRDKKKCGDSDGVKTDSECLLGWKQSEKEREGGKKIRVIFKTDFLLGTRSFFLSGRSWGWGQGRNQCSCDSFKERSKNTSTACSFIHTHVSFTTRDYWISFAWVKGRFFPRRRKCIYFLFNSFSCFCLLLFFFHFLVQCSYFYLLFLKTCF